MDELLQIGTIVKPQGIKGEVKVYPITDDPKRFLQLKSVFVRRNGVDTPVRVMGARVNGNDVYLLLERCYDRNAAELLRNAELYVDRQNAVKLPEGRVFIVDIIGCEVADRSGNVLGTLTDVLQPGANDVYVVTGADGGEILIPAVAAFVDKIDIEGRRVTVNADMLAMEEVSDN